MESRKRYRSQIEDMGLSVPGNSLKNHSAKNCFLTLNLVVISSNYTPCLADKE